MDIGITPKHLWATSGVFLLAAGVTAAACGFFFSSPAKPLVDDSPPPPLSSHSPIPHSFCQSCTLKDALHSPPFSLSLIDRPIRLPDLRSLLVFYGSNDRPDRSATNQRFQVGLRGTQTLTSVQAGEKVFFKYDTKANRWAISESPTPLSALFSPQELNAAVTVEYKDADGSSVTSPQDFHSFSLTPTPPPSTAAPAHQWSIGELPVDSSLLERQGGFWWGQDEVVKAFGGDEMAREACRQRVQFGVGANAYVIWVAEGDCFVYDEGKWKAAEPGSETIGKPFLKAKSIEARAMHFLLWNPEGSAHLTVDLLHRGVAGEVKVPSIKIIGARSKKQWIAEILGKRVTLAPDDWVLLKPDGFAQIDTAEMLDEYIQGRLSGNLLVFSGIEKVNGELCLIGTFYDTTRTRHEDFAVSLYRSWGPKDHASESKQSEEEDDDDDDDFDDDDDDFDYDDDDDEEESDDDDV